MQITTRIFFLASLTLATACGGKVVLDGASTGSGCTDACTAVSAICPQQTSGCAASCAVIDALVAKNVCTSEIDAAFSCILAHPQAGCGQDTECSAEDAALEPCLAAACQSDPSACPTSTSTTTSAGSGF